MNDKRYKKSIHLNAKGQDYLVPGSTTISKSPILFPFGAYPIYLSRGAGCIVEDIDGNSYIDFQGSLGANLLGMAYPEVVDAMLMHIKRGNLFSLLHPLAVKVAEQLCEMIPSAEKVRLLKNGSDATTGAIRIARAYTKKEHIAYCHFHGWHDWYYVSTDMNRGIPKKMKEWVHPFTYNNLESLEKLFEKYPQKIGAVIMEPIHLDVPKPDFLNQVKNLVESHNALLIFDEVVTGFRFSPGGAQEYFGVTPHLSCFGKALSNGSALSAIVGKESVMMDTQDVITSMTFAEEAIALAAASETLSFLKREPVSEHIFKLGAKLRNGINLLAKKYSIPILCQGLPPRMELTYDQYGPFTRKHVKGYFLEQMALEGILIGDTIFLSYSHTDTHIKSLLDSCENIFQKMSSGEDSLPRRGAIPKELW